MESLRGSLLIAGPALDDPNFHRTVVLVCAHDDEGALGLVLNRPSALALADAVPEVSEAVGEDGRLWIGGPVAPTAVVLLAELEGETEALVVSEALGLVTERASLADLQDGTRRVRAFQGYAGWGPGQLDAEVERDDWIVAELERDDPFSEDAERLWPVTLERLGGSYALVARMPPDPRLN